MLMCRVLKVARAGFYQWLHQPVSQRAKEDARLVEVIRYSHSASDGVYGANGVFRDPREAGETCGRNRVARLMHVNKIKAVRGYKAPRRIAGRPSIIAPNRLNREFTVDAPDQAWAPISLISERGRAGFTLPSWSIYSHARSWVGR